MSEKSNFHKIHEERNALRELDIKGELVLPIEQEIKNSAEEAHAEFHIKDFGNLSNAKQEVRYQRERFRTGLIIDHEAISKALGDKESELLAQIQEKSSVLVATIASRARKLREMTGNPKKTELYKALIRALNVDLELKQTELHTLQNENSKIFRIKDLIMYREGLFEKGHIAEVPSVQVYLRKIEEAMIEGKPMFLHGPTGTGKTSLAIRTAEKLTGKDPEIVYCNPQTKESNIFGKTGIGIDEKTEKQVTQFDYGPLVRAMREGKVVIFDEFTALPKDMMVMLKGIMNAKVGDTRTITGDGEVTIAEGFQMIFTANLKSEKNQERQDIPPEMANEFAQNNLEVAYQNEDESYSIMLARLLHQDGTLDMSKHDIDVTLPKLCTAIANIQKAYTGRVEGNLGGNEGLKKLVFNQRTVENILSRWRTACATDEEGDFVTFLDTQLAIPLTFKEYSEKDRVLAAKILAGQGLLSTVRAQDIGLPHDTFSFNAQSSVDAMKKSTDIKHYTLKEVADLDPFEKRGGKAKADVAALVAGLPNPEVNVGTLDASEIHRILKSLGSPATPDTTIEGGLFTFEIDPQTAEALETPEGAKQTFKDADGGSTHYFGTDVFDIRVDQWEPLTTTTLDTCIIEHGETTPLERQKLIADMDTAGYRLPTRTELIALAVTRPDINKIPNKYFTTLKEYTLDGSLQAPIFRLVVSNRYLRALDVDSGWSDGCRFVFVRK